MEDTKVCQECGEPFVPERPYHALCPTCYRKQTHPLPSRRSRQHAAGDALPDLAMWGVLLILLILVMVVISLAGG